jgi:hypothetical protein
MTSNALEIPEIQLHLWLKKWHFHFLVGSRVTPNARSLLSRGLLAWERLPDEKMHEKLRARLDSTVSAYSPVTGWTRGLDRREDIQTRHTVAAILANDWLDVQIFSQFGFFSFPGLGTLAAAL